MTEFPHSNHIFNNNNEQPTITNQNPNPKISLENQIPLEIISEEEMALIETAMAAARPSVFLSSCSSITACSSSSSSQLQRNTRSIGSITALSKRGLPSLVGLGSGCDIEDSDRNRSPQKKGRVSESLLSRFRQRRGLYVTDITATEWCEKQMEFSLLLSKREITKAMEAGITRHTKLEEEVVKKVKVHVRSHEDAWARRFMNFIVGINQLLFEGLTRELPLIGFVEGVWMVGVIDELRMPITGGAHRIPTIVDTKTRVQAQLPSEPQQRNGRLQLMCYKYLWDNLVASEFPSQQFFDFFSLNPLHTLSSEIRTLTADSGFCAATLDELVRYFRNSCSVLPSAHNQLLLRYELQEDNSLIGEDKFIYDVDWLKSQIHTCLEFWHGSREPDFVTEDERWKCRFCQYATVCPSQPNPVVPPPSAQNKQKC